MMLVDDKGHGDEDALVLGNTTGCPTAIGADERMVMCRRGSAFIYAGGALVTTYAGCGFEYGVGDDDTINLFSDRNLNTSLCDTTLMLDERTNSNANSWGRTTHDGTGPFHITARTPGLPNHDNPPPSPPPPIPPPPPLPPVTPGSDVVDVPKAKVESCGAHAAPRSPLSAQCPHAH